MKQSVEDIISIIKSFQERLLQHFPALEQEAFQLIKNKPADKNAIENMLDTILSLTDLGIGNDLFIKLLEYYKTIDAEGAIFYWNEYDRKEEE